MTQAFDISNLTPNKAYETLCSHWKDVMSITNHYPGKDGAYIVEFTFNEFGYPIESNKKYTFNLNMLSAMYSQASLEHIEKLNKIIFEMKKSIDFLKNELEIAEKTEKDS